MDSTSIEKTNDLYETPPEWNALTLYELAGSSKSGFDDGDWIESEFISESGARLIQTGNIGEGVFKDSDRKRYVSDEHFALLNCKDVVEGDLLVCRLADPAGRAAIVPSLGERRMLTSVDVTIFRPMSHLADKNYLLQVFGTQEWLSAVNERCGGSTRSRIARGELGKIRIPVPPIAEQRAIAAALSEVDDLVAALDALIEKKRAVKTAAMQRLLTGRQRLPGFSGEWETVNFGDLTQPRRERVDPKSSRSDMLCVELEHIDSGSGRLLGSTTLGGQASLKTSFRKADVLFGKLRSYLRKHWLADRPGACSTEIWVLPADGERLKSAYLYQLVTTDQFIEVASTAHGTHMPRSDWKVVKNFVVQLPSAPEQEAIAAVLTDMDTEIAALEARREKTRMIKQGMMQELLTGRTRLVQPVSTQPAVPPHQDAPAVPPRPHPVRRAKDRGHNWAIDEAVVISCLADRYASPEHPIGRERRTKLTYLIRRHDGQAPEGFLKQAAGPYNPQTKYGGPEGIAKKNGYVRERGKYKGFVAADNIEQARGYFADWYGEDALDWLDRFRYFKTKDLGALTTVDYAALELRREGKLVTVESVKGVLAADETWAPKLQQPEFTDEKIEEAIRLSEELFGTALPDEA